MKRKIIRIDEGKCNGCGLCIPNCPEGALQIIDGKARLISDLFCDGLGACIGECPLGAIEIIEREADAYDERKVMSNIVKAGKNTIKAHLLHLKEHNEIQYLKIALDYLKENNIENPLKENEIKMNTSNSFSACPGARTIDFSDTDEDKKQDSSNLHIASQLKQWPIQLHLISPMAPYYQGKDLLLAADCTAFASGVFHNKFLKGKSLAIACPKLDNGQDIYIEKITSLIDDAKINTLTVLIMQVPCCGGLLYIAKQAREKAKRNIPIKSVVLNLQGEILSEEWV